MCLRTHYKFSPVGSNKLLNRYLCISDKVYISLQCCNRVFVSVVCVCPVPTSLFYSLILWKQSSFICCLIIMSLKYLLRLAHRNQRFFMV